MCTGIICHTLLVMKTGRAQLKLIIRVYEPQLKTLSEEETRRRLKELFLLLWEISEQNNVSKEYSSAQEDK